MELIAGTIVILGLFALLALLAWIDRDRHGPGKRPVSESDAKDLALCRDLLTELDTAAREGLLARTAEEKEVEAAVAALVIGRARTEPGRLARLIATLDRLADSGTED